MAENATARSDDLVEVKLRANFVTRRFPGGPAKVGEVRKVPKKMADDLIARGTAVLYDEKQKKLDETAEANAKAAIAAREAEEKAAEAARAAAAQEKERSSRTAARSGVSTFKPGQMPQK